MSTADYQRLAGRPEHLRTNSKYTQIHFKTKFSSEQGRAPSPKPRYSVIYSLITIIYMITRKDDCALDKPQTHDADINRLTIATAVTGTFNLVLYSETLARG